MGRQLLMTIVKGVGKAFWGWKKKSVDGQSRRKIRMSFHWGSGEGRGECRDDGG